MHLYCYLMLSLILFKYRDVVNLIVNGKLLLNKIILIIICNIIILLERQFSWGGSLLKSNGGEYIIYFI